MMIVQINRKGRRSFCIHFPRELVLNWCTAWMGSGVLRRFVQVTICATDLSRLMRELGQYGRSHGTISLVEVCSQNGDHVGIWLQGIK